jgi:1,4-dihydroxy-2-naphthoate octaprenyltransferase
MKMLRSFSRTIKPDQLVICVLVYGLGVGIADYQGKTVNFQVYLLGQSWIILIQLSISFLSEYFTPSGGNITEIKEKDSLTIDYELAKKKIFWWGSLVCLTCAAVLSVLMIKYELLSTMVVLLFILLAVGVILFTVPAVIVNRSGFGDLFLAFWTVFLIPAFAYSLQGSANLRLLFFILAPIFFLHLAMQLALELKSYKVFPGGEPRSFFDHFGWRIGIHSHNAFIIASFICVGFGSIWGLPKFTFYIGLSMLPLGVFQIIQMRRILIGAKPLWNLIGLAAYSLFFLNSYLLTYAYWVQ